MKKYLSVLGLFARCSIYKFLWISLVLCLSEISLFFLNFHGKYNENYVARFEFFVDKSHLDVCLAISFILVTFILCIPGTELGSKVGYTLQRLSISEKAVFYHQAAFNAMIFVFLWALQMGLLFIFGLWYSAAVPAEFANNLSIFLAFNRNEFLHSVLPLSEIMLWIRNISFVLSLSFASAGFSYMQRRKKYSFSILIVLIFILLFFKEGIGENGINAASIFLSIIIITKVLYNVCRKEDSYDK